MRTREPIRNIVIIGGGTAGWMAAAALSGVLGRAGTRITLVESDEIGTVGVGEATIPSLLEFNAILGLDENEMLRETNGTFKLGIEFLDWGRIGDHYIHPFGSYGRNLEGVDFHHFWLAVRQRLGAGAAGDISDYNVTAKAASLGRFSRPSGNRGTILSTLAYAYHFDAALYARYLRRLSEQAGVERIEGKVVSAQRRAEDGFLTSVTLEDGRVLEGDLFLDCSGFRALLLGETLGVEYRDWSSWLPCDRAVALPVASVGPPQPYTRATADLAGWRWRIPLQHRVGTGYVYSSAHLDREAATARIFETAAGVPLGDPRHLDFTPGRRERLWEANCVAIGLAGGFIEPLESTSIHLIQKGITRLLALFPDRSFDPEEIREYNRLVAAEYEMVRDFIILHYKATERDDTPFWRHCRDMSVPDSLAHKMALFRGKGRIVQFEPDLFGIDNWLAVMLGQNLVPESHDPLADTAPIDQVAGYLAELRAAVANTAEALPIHADYIRAHCANGGERHAG